MESKEGFIHVDLANTPPWCPSSVHPSVKDVESHYQRFGEYPEFIVMISGGVLPTTLFFDGEGWFDHANEYYSVTHWMPLPLPPRDLSVLQKL